MVIGNGLVANAFESYRHNKDVVVFASGVSNSSNKDTAEFARESNLLKLHLSQYKNRLFVYFSTCAIYDPILQTSMYVQHKKAMEQLIADNHNNYCIFRISNIAGKTENPNTILNYLYQHIREVKSFVLWEGAERNIIDVEDAFYLCDTIIKNTSGIGQNIYDIANIHNYRVETIVKEIECHIAKKGNYTVIPKHSRPHIPMTGMDLLQDTLYSIFTSDYLKKVIQKYYS